MEEAIEASYLKAHEHDYMVIGTWAYAHGLWGDRREGSVEVHHHNEWGGVGGLRRGGGGGLGWAGEVGVGWTDGVGWGGGGTVDLPDFHLIELTPRPLIPPCAEVRVPLGTWRRIASDAHPPVGMSAAWAGGAQRGTRLSGDRRRHDPNRDPPVTK